MVEQHLPLATALARRFDHRGESMDDLRQVAMLALVKAATRYEADRGVEFSSFAATSVLGELKRHFRDFSWHMRVPRQTQETYLAVKAASGPLEQQLHRMPTAEELGECLGADPKEIEDAIRAGGDLRPTSLDGPAGDDEMTLMDTVGVDEPAYDSVLDRDALRDLLPRLRPDEAVVLRRYFFDEWPQWRIGEELGMSQMQVSRLLHRILGRLQQALVGTGAGHRSASRQRSA